MTRLLAPLILLILALAIDESLKARDRWVLCSASLKKVAHMSFVMRLHVCLVNMHHHSRNDLCVLAI